MECGSALVAPAMKIAIPISKAFTETQGLSHAAHNPFAIFAASVLQPAGLIRGQNGG